VAVDAARGVWCCWLTKPAQPQPSSELCGRCLRHQVNFFYTIPLLPARAAAQQVQRPSLTLEQEEELERKDHALGSLLDKLGGSLHTKSLNISPSKARFGVGAWLSACVLLFCVGFRTRTCCRRSRAAALHSSLHASLLCALFVEPQSCYCAACVLVVGLCRSSYSSSKSHWCRTAVGACPQMPCASCWSSRPMLLGALCRHKTS
jgi:hypothetical protein